MNANKKPASNAYLEKEVRLDEVVHASSNRYGTLPEVKQFQRNNGHL